MLWKEWKDVVLFGGLWREWCMSDLRLIPKHLAALSIRMLGKAWTSEEYDQLLVELSESKSYEDIAKEHDRTVNAIKFKALAYASNQVLKDGKTPEEVAESVGLTLEEVQSELDKRTKPRLPIVQKVPKVSMVPKAKPVVVVKKGDVSELKDILSLVNSAQSLLARYINKIELK